MSVSVLALGDITVSLNGFVRGRRAQMNAIKIRRRATLVVGVLLSLVCENAVSSIIFNTFVSQSSLDATLSNHSTIGFSYAGDKFVGSVYFGTNNNQLYQTDLNGGNAQTFGAPVSGYSGEIFVSSSLGLGGFGSREVFAGSEAQSTIERFSADGSSQSAFVTLPNTPTGGTPGGIRGIAFDPYGAYGGDMLVTTNQGNVYRVNSSGVATWLANVGGDAEGLDFAPQAFGNVAAGTLVVLSEGTGRVVAVDAGGSTTDLGLGFSSPENLIFVPLNLGISGNPLEGFYAANYPVDVQKAAASEFMSYIGDVIITEEVSHAIYDVKWDGMQYVRTLIGSYPDQPEDGIFVTAAILNPGCTETNTCQGSMPEPATVALLGIGLAILGLGRRRRAK